MLLLAACGDDAEESTEPVPEVEPVPENESVGSDDAGDTEDPVSSAPSSPPGDGSGAPGASDPDVEADRVIEVTVSGDTVDGGGRQQVAVGDTVALVITADVIDEVHVHGYDLYADLVPGEPATVTFEATMPGVWEVELHDAGTALVELQVS
jgi:hypothetical protein